ncbi:MAG: hypothetical protein AAF004_04875 [Pseudomonadota bacterium]
MTEHISPAAALLQTLTIYLTPAQRDALSACIALRDTILATTHATKEVVPVKLAWWQEELQRLANGEARHPDAVRLQNALDLNTDALSLVNEWHVVARRTAASDPLQNTTDLELDAFRHFGTVLLLGLFEARERVTADVTEQVCTCSAALYDIDHPVDTTTIDAAFAHGIDTRLQSVNDAPQSMSLAILAALLAQYAANKKRSKALRPFTATLIAWRTARRWRKRNPE